GRGSGERHVDREHGALAGRRAAAEAVAAAFGEPGRDCEPQTVAVRAFRGFAALPGLEHAVDLLRGDAGPRVRNDDAHGTAQPAATHEHLAALRVLDRIGYEIADEAHRAHGVAVYSR